MFILVFDSNLYVHNKRVYLRLNNINESIMFVPTFETQVGDKHFD